MQNTFKIVLGLGILSYIVSISACSTASVRVMPGPDGVNTVVARDSEKDSSEAAGIDAANDYCKKQKKTAVFLETKAEYTGTMDEKTRETVRRTSQGSSAAAGAMGGYKSKRNEEIKDQIRDLERERSMEEMQSRGMNGEQHKKRVEQLDAQIAKLRSEQEKAGGGVEEVAGVAGVAGQAFTAGRDYKNEIRFKCQ
jgi:hypothetical protein